MDPLKISAQFAAFMWFKNRAGTAVSDKQAWAYVDKAWRSFLPCAHEGMGKLLLLMAKGRSRGRTNKGRERELALAN